jgi:hypothetical protein
MEVQENGSEEGYSGCSVGERAFVADRQVAIGRIWLTSWKWMCVERNAMPVLPDYSLDGSRGEAL